MNILVFDTSSSYLKAALKVNNKESFIELENGFKHIENLLPSIDRCFTEIKEKKKLLEYIGVCTGPGSFTGIRIGISTAKGICYARGINNFGFSSFDIYRFLFRDLSDTVLIPIVDAKKKRFYCTFINNQYDDYKFYDISLNEIIEKIEKDYKDKKVYFTGRDSYLIKDMLPDNVDYEFKYENSYSAKDMLDYSVNLINSGFSFRPIKPIYLRKSEAELALLKKKGKII